MRSPRRHRKDLAWAITWGLSKLTDFITLLFEIINTKLSANADRSCKSEANLLSGTVIRII